MAPGTGKEPVLGWKWDAIPLPSEGRQGEGTGQVKSLLVGTGEEGVLELKGRAQTSLESVMGWLAGPS